MIINGKESDQLFQLGSLFSCVSPLPTGMGVESMLPYSVRWIFFPPSVNQRETEATEQNS